MLRALLGLTCFAYFILSLVFFVTQPAISEYLQLKPNASRGRKNDETKVLTKRSFRECI